MGKVKLLPDWNLQTCSSQERPVQCWKAEEQSVKEAVKPQGDRFWGTQGSESGLQRTERRGTAASQGN